MTESHTSTRSHSYAAELGLAALAGSLARIVCHPLDTVKTVSFTGFASANGTGSLQRPSLLRCAKHVWAGEGIRGFYRGFGVTFCGSAPGAGLYLSVYHSSSQLLQTMGGAAAERHSAWIFFVSGLIAEAVSCLIWVPVDVSKERLQSQPPSLASRYRGSADALKTIMRYEGLGGMYKGYFSTLASFGPFSGVYFVVYESLLRKASKFASCGVTGEPLPWWAPLAAGVGATAVASTVTNPLELVKTRLQVQRTVLVGATPDTRLFSFQYRSLFGGIRTVARQEGLCALWKGTVSRIAFQAPNTSLTMCLYECFVRNTHCRNAV